MNLLFYRYGSICEPDFIEGFKELGNTVDELTYEIEDKNIPAAKRVELISTALLKKSYDFVFSINYYPFISEVCNIYKIRYICQTVDSPIMELFSSSIKREWNRIFLFDMAQYKEFQPLNPDCIFHLPLATNPKRWAKVINSASSIQKQKFTSDISFVGSLYTEKCPYDKLQAKPYLNGYLMGLMKAQQKIYGYHFIEEIISDETIEEFVKSMPEFYIPPEEFIGNDKKTSVRLYMDYKITSMERIDLLTALGNKFNINLYTGSSTEGIPVNNRGRVKTLSEMPLVFYNSKINLNFTAKSIREGLPLRIFDVLGCGGFLITNYQSELPDIFNIGEDLEAYTGEDDLLYKTEYYLTHENDRLEIANNGYNKLVKYHNYPERIMQMLEMAFLGKKQGADNE
nr:DUF3880 domain-containing protein [uncultured Catonella sp.]